MKKVKKEKVFAGILVKLKLCTSNLIIKKYVHTCLGLLDDIKTSATKGRPISSGRVNLREINLFNFYFISITYLCSVMY